MTTTIEDILQVNVSSILIIAGIIFIAFAIFGRLGNWIDLNKKSRLIASSFGAVIVIIGLLLSLKTSDSTTTTQFFNYKLILIGGIIFIASAILGRLGNWIDLNKKSRLIAGSLGIVMVIISVVLLFVKSTKPPHVSEGENILPIFSIEKPIIQSGAEIVIIPENEAAKKKKELDVEFDGILFRKKGIITNENKWIFDIKRMDNIQKDMLSDGLHKLRFRFLNEGFSETTQIRFFTKTPIVKANIIDNQKNGEWNTEKTNNKIISGMAASELQHESEMLKVDFFFQHEGKSTNVEVPVKKITDPEGRIYFEFLLQIDSIPLFSENDKRYSEPFFALTVTDQAGNKYHDQMSYAQFMSPGLRTFGVGNLANIRLSTDHIEIEDKKKATSINVRIVPDIEPVQQLYNGSPGITLKVNKHQLNMNQLEWSNLPDEIKPKKTITNILKNGENIAISFNNNTYIDSFILKDEDVKYQVIQTSKDGVRYSSNVAYVHQVSKNNLSDIDTSKELNSFLSQLEPGEWAVIVGSYKNKTLAEDEIQKIKAKYPELFLPQASEIYKRYYDNYGEAKYFDGKYWAIYIGGFYSYESANLLREKAIAELGLDEDSYLKTPLIPTEISEKENIEGWLFIGAYNNENRQLYGNINGYPHIGKQFEFIRRDKIFNIRTDPPETVNTYYEDINRSRIVGRVKGGDIFTVKEVKEYSLNSNLIKIWAKIQYN